MFGFEHKNRPRKESEQYETPGLRRYGRIEHITLESPYVNIDCSVKGGALVDSGNLLDDCFLTP